MILKGAPVVDQIKADIMHRVIACKEKGIQTKLAIVRVGERSDDLSYEKRVVKNCENLGIEVELVALSQEITKEDFYACVDQINQDNRIHGILLFRPLPKSLEGEEVNYLISPEKDIDCMHPEHLSKIFEGKRGGMLPCTPEAVIEILKFYKVEMEGANVAIVNRSLVLGKPLAMMFLWENATVTLCHSKTKNTQQVLSQADIVVTGIRKPKYFGKSCFTDQSVIMDVGINFDEQGMCGDVDYQGVGESVKGITPVPGGVGPVTSMILLRHLVSSAERKIGR